MLRLLRLISTALLLLFTLLAGMDLHVRNPQLVAVNYYGGSTEMTVSVLIAGTLLVGAVLGMLAALVTWKMNSPRRYPALLLDPDRKVSPKPQSKTAQESG